MHGRLRSLDSREKAEGRRRRYSCSCGARFTTIELHVKVIPGRPGMPRNGSTAVNVLKEEMMLDAERRAKDRLRELLDQQL